MNLELMDIFRMEYDFSWDTETWFLPLESALEGLNSTDASWQPPGGGNTIWQTVNHLNYYNALLVSQINGTTPRNKASNNKATFGDIGEPADSEKWKAVLAETRLIFEKLRKSLEQVNDSQLDEELVGGLARQILHNVYHIGQIVLIRKQQGSWPQERE
ncbi:DinB family protein [Bacillus sp. RHFB]|nr:DinB family protein [Bacillus sp. RHFB]